MLQLTAEWYVSCAIPGMYHRVKQIAMMATAAVLASSSVAFADPTTTREPKAGWFSHLFDGPSWKEAVAAADSPRKAANLVRLHVRFQEDIGDEWADGKTTWDRGFGDCEDFAATVIQLCKEANLDVDAAIQVFSVTGSERHAVAVGSWQGRMWIASNGWFEFVDSMEHAAEVVAREMDWHDRTVTVTPLDMANRTAIAVAAASSPAGE